MFIILFAIRPHRFGKLRLRQSGQRRTVRVRINLPVESLVQAGRLQPSVVPGVAFSSVRPLKRAWAVVSADRRARPDPTESSPQLVGNASCEVKGTRIFPT